MCQLAFGNTRAASLNLRKSPMRRLNAPPRYFASSKIARRGFCSHRGKALSLELLDSERMDLPVGSLDEPGQLKPTERVGAGSRAERWFRDDGLPQSRIDENSAIQQRWRDTDGIAVMPGLQAVLLGDRVMDWLPVQWVHRITAAVFAVLGVLVLLGYGG